MAGDAVRDEADRLRYFSKTHEEYGKALDRAYRAAATKFYGHNIGWLPLAGAPEQQAGADCLFIAIENTLTMLILGPALFEDEEVHIPQPLVGRVAKFVKVSYASKNTINPQSRRLINASAGPGELMFSSFRAHRVHHMQLMGYLAGIFERCIKGADVRKLQASLKAVVVAFVKRPDVTTFSDEDL